MFIICKSSLTSKQDLKLYNEIEIKRRIGVYNSFAQYQTKFMQNTLSKNTQTIARAHYGRKSASALTHSHFYLRQKASAQPARFNYHKVETLSSDFWR